MEKKYSQREDIHLTVLIEQNSFFVQFFCPVHFFRFLCFVTKERRQIDLVAAVAVFYYCLVFSFFVDLCLPFSKL